MKRIGMMTVIFWSSVLFGQKFENLALTPPMGWNSWNCLRCEGIHEEAIREIADAMVSSGMKDAGYEYIVIDDCWQIGRDADGNIIPDPVHFPSGIKALSDYIHSRGLKFGIYSDAGIKTCQGRPGSRGYEFQDARQYAEWGVDYLKYDWCYAEDQNPAASYRLMRDALYAAGRPVVFSICNWGLDEPWEWAGDIGHLWRTTFDIRDCWDCKFTRGSGGVLTILDQQSGLEKYAGPGRWNDPDMLEIGNEALTEAESRAHFSLWCMLAAPLIAGNDIRSMSESTRRILTHKEAIAINQDPLRRQGGRRIVYGQIEVWQKRLKDGLAVCFLNRSDKTEKIELTWDMMEIEKEFDIRDIWKMKNNGTTHRDPEIRETIQAHDVLLFRLRYR